MAPTILLAYRMVTPCAGALFSPPNLVRSLRIFARSTQASCSSATATNTSASTTTSRWVSFRSFFLGARDKVVSGRFFSLVTGPLGARACGWHHAASRLDSKGRHHRARSGSPGPARRFELFVSLLQLLPSFLPPSPLSRRAVVVMGVDVVPSLLFAFLQECTVVESLSFLRGT